MENMKTWFKMFLILMVITGCSNPVTHSAETDKLMVKLPDPVYDSNMSVEQALLERRSVRSYSEKALTIKDVSQLLWAAQGVTNSRGFRTSPSAGALYPMEIYLVAGHVTDLSAGVYRYEPGDHVLKLVKKGDLRQELCKAALSQSPVKNAPAVLVLSAVYDRTTTKYGQRGIQYVHWEAGNVSQNVHLQAETRGMGTVIIGAFNEDNVKKVLQLKQEETPLGLMPVGKKQ